MSNGALIMRSADDRWYCYQLNYKSYPDHTLPRLQEGWTKQESVEVILDTCGLGVKMVFKNGKADEGAAFSGMSGWHDGDNFDHSPEWSHSPEQPHKFKTVAEKYYQGPHGRENAKSYDTKEDALASTFRGHVYIWDGEKWEYFKNAKPKRRRDNVWGRR